MSKISALPLLAEDDINGGERVPVVRDGQTWQAEIGYLAAEAARQAQNAAASVYALGNFRTTLADAVADFADGTVFTTNENGALEAYIRIADMPGYERRPELDPAAKVDLEAKANVADLESADHTKGSTLIRKGYARVGDLLPITPDQFKLPDHPDDTASIIEAEEYCYTNKKQLVFKGRQYFYSSDITFRCEVLGEGVNTTWLVKTESATIYHEEGAFRGVKIAPLAPISGDESDGFVAQSPWRKDIEIRTEDHGGDGFVFKKGNLSRAKVYSRRNRGRGIWCPTDSDGDNKCLELWAECTANGSAGLEIEAGTDVNMAGCMRGFIIAQHNGEDAPAGSDYNAILAGLDHDLVIYSEYGANSIHLTNKLKSSNIYLQVASYVTMLDESSNNNNVISYTYGSMGDRRFKSLRSESFSVHKKTFIGTLDLTQTGDREFTLVPSGSGAQQILRLGENLVFRNANNKPLVSQVYSGATLNFGEIPAGGTVERTIELADAPLANSVVSAMPRSALPSGLVFDAYSTDAAPGAVVIRLTNVTAAQITDTNRAWRVQALSQ